MTVFIYLLLGAVAGFLGGLLGLGGGIVVVPALFFIFRGLGFLPEAVMHMAVGTSLATVVLTAAVSTWAHHRHGAVLWPAVARFAPGIVIGSLAGGVLADQLAGSALRIVFGLFELLVAAQLAFGLQPKPTRTLPSAGPMAWVGAGIGALSAVLGIGGGTMTVPYLVWCNVGIRQAVATSAACGLPIAVAATVSHTIAGLHTAGLPPGSTGYVYWPAVLMTGVASVVLAPAGARVAHAISMVALKRIFAGVVAIIGIRMLIG
jgi:uncharacterized membrane protein YfcA